MIDDDVLWVSLVILIVPDFLNNAGKICQVDLFFEGLVGSLCGDDDIIDHIAHLHRQLRRLVDVGSIAGVGFCLLTPLIPLLVPLGLMLHYILSQYCELTSFQISQLYLNERLHLTILSIFYVSFGGMLLILNQIIVMRKNRSFNENSFARSRGSRGKEVSIELDHSKNTPTPSYRYDDSSRNTTDRVNGSNWHHNPSLSQNILKEILNYSNITQSTTRRPTTSTLAVFDKSGDNVLSQLAKINKKVGQSNTRKETKRLTLDFVQSKEIRQDKQALLSMSKSLALEELKIPQVKPQTFPACKSVTICQVSEQQRTRLQLQKSQSAAYLQQLAILEQSIQNEHSQMIPYWQRMVNCETAMASFESNTQKLEQSISNHKLRIESLNLSLLNINKQFLLSRQEWDSKGSGARAHLVDEAESAQEQFLRKVTVRDFSDTVLFNIKVAIPEYKGKTSLRSIYEQLFRNRCAKKFTMILKKHSAHMDLYDGRLLSDFTKRINDLEALYLKADSEAKHQDQHFLESMVQLVGEIEYERSALSRDEVEIQQLRHRLQQAREQQRLCEQGIHQQIDEINNQVRGEYQRQTEKQADFKTLLLNKTIGKYKQFRSIRQRKIKAIQQLQAFQQKLLRSIVQL